MRTLFHRSHMMIVFMVTALAGTALVPAIAAGEVIQFDPPILVDHLVPSGIVHGAPGFVSVQPHAIEDLDGPLETSVFFSADGFNWTVETTIPTARLTGVASGGPGFVAVGAKRIAGDLLGPAVWVSADGLAWTEVSGVPTIASASPAQAVPASVDALLFRGSWMTDVGFDGATLTAVGRDDGPRGALWTSTDGITWARALGSPFGESEAVPERIAASASGWMMVTRLATDADSPGPIFTWWSSDGTSWFPADDDDSFGSETGVGPFTKALLGFADGFVMAGISADLDPVTWISTDGRSWRAPETLPTRPETDSSFVHDAATDGSSLVVVGDDVVFDVGLGPATSEAAIWTSSNGSDWAQVEPTSLRGAVTLRSLAARAVHSVDGWWVVHGTTADDVDEPTTIEWIGRPIDAGTFADVPPGHLFFDDVEWLSSNDITRSCNPPANTLFCPKRTVTRGQMAAFLVRAFGFTDDGGGDLYVDDDESIFELDIDKLGTAGITRGCNPPDNDRYCPSDSLTRAHLAAFLRRGFE